MLQFRAVSFAFNSSGDLASASDAAATYAYSHDGLGRVTRGGPVDHRPVAAAYQCARRVLPDLACLESLRRSPNSFANEEPDASPRLPRLSAESTVLQFKPPEPAIGPESRLWNTPCRLKYALPHCAICSKRNRFDSGTRGNRLDLPSKMPRCLLSRPASVRPPGNPRDPRRSALSIALQVSPGSPLIGPESRYGQWPCVL